MSKKYIFNDIDFDTSSNNVSSSRGVCSHFLFIVFMIILICSFARLLFNYSKPLTFSTFLSILQNAPNISFSMPFDLTIDGEWAVLDGLRVVINSLSSILEVICWIGNMLLQVLEYVLYMVINLLGVKI